ncbi:MAG: hypothetical protein IPJ25_08500 [Rhodocyclaceae bacterium]|nr:hypothetical protein [Rhodocyclaceae bacterium]
MENTGGESSDMAAMGAVPLVATLGCVLCNEFNSVPSSGTFRPVGLPVSIAPTDKFTALTVDRSPFRARIFRLR